MSNPAVKIHPFGEILELKLSGFAGVPYIEQRRMVSRAIKAAVAEYDKLQAENERLKAALIQHRADLHCGSGRPCGTCKQSAEALGIDVPDRCAQAHIDKQALKRESK